MSRTRLFVSTLFIVIVGLLAAPASWAGGLIPASTSPLATTSAGKAVLLVDLDGDTNLDMVVAEGASGNVDIYQGNGSGTFTLKQTVNLGVGTNAVAVAAGHLTGALLPDIAVADASGNVFVLQNNGAFGSAFTVLGPYAVPGTTPVPSAVAVADMDGDLNPDVVVVDSFNNQVDILLGNGIAALTLTATASGPYPVGSSPAALTVADFNFDGAPDLAVANKGGNSVTILTNAAGLPGDVSFGSTATSTVGTAPDAIASGLVGTTGRPDLVVATSTGVSVLLNNGFGAFPASSTNTAVAGSPTGIGLGDFNADGKNDIVVSDANGADVLFNNGTGGFAGPSVNFPTVGASAPSAIAVGDVAQYPNLAADGLADVVIPDSGNTKVFILLGTPFFNVSVTPAPAPVEGTAFNGTLATFQYDNDATATDFTATVTDWGAGAVSDAENVTCNAITKVCTVDASTTPHTYPDEGAQTIKITLANTAVAPNQTYAAQGNTTVTDATLVAGVEADLHQTEPNVTISNLEVANFTDNNPAAVLATDFAAGATIHWGDGNTDLAVPITQPGGVGTPFIIKGTHTYASKEEATYQVTFDVADVGGSSITGGTGVKIIIDDATLTVAAPPVVAAQTEGVSYTGPVGGFTDANNQAPLCPGGSCDFTVLVHWGDTTSSAGTVTGPIGGPYVVGGTHTYAEKGVFSVTFDVTDVGGSTLTGAAGAAITVNDAALTVAAAPVVAAQTEGVSFAALNVAAFTDANTLSPACPGGTCDFTVLIHWGDTTSSAGTVTGGPGTGAGPVTFTVSGGHTYAEKGVFNVTFDVTDVDGATLVGAAGASITVNDAALTVAAAPPNTSLVEPNANFAGVNVGAFTDANTLSPLCPGGTCDFTVLIHWGDGNSSAGIVTGGPGTGAGAVTFTVSGTHAYASNEEHTYNVTFDVTDVDGATLTGAAGSSLIVTDAPLAGAAAPVVAAQIEGISYTGPVGNFTDGNGQAPACPGGTCDFTVLVHWGDTTSSAGTVTGPLGGPYAVGGTHAYAEKGVFNVTFDVTDVGGSTLTGAAGASITVNDAALTAAAAPVVAAQAEGISYTGPVGNFTDANTLSPACPGGTCDFTVLVHWGDTTSSAGTVTGGPGTGVGPVAFSVGGTHTYAEKGVYNVTFDVTDVDGATLVGAAGASITVNDAALSAAAAPAVPAQIEGTAFTNIPVAAFTDANTLAPACPGGTCDFPLLNITIHWGDGKSSNATAVAGGPGTGIGPVVFTVSGTHTYAEKGVFNVTIDVADVEGSTVIGAPGAAITVGDAALTPQAPPPPFNTSGTGAVSGVVIGSFQDANTLAPGCPATCDFTVLIHWGDATTSVGTVTGGPGTGVGPVTFTVSGSHNYTTPNATFQVTFDVTDIDGASISGATGAQITTPNFTSAAFTVLVSPPQAQIHSGQSLDLLITLSPNVPGGWPSQVSLTCGGLDATMSCSSASVQDVTVVRQVHILLTTQQHFASLSAPPLAGRNGPVQLALLLPTLFGTAGVVLLTPKTRKGNKRGILWLFLSFLLLAILLIGCGGGAALGTPSGGTPPGVYNVTINSGVPGVNVPTVQITVQ